MSDSPSATSDFPPTATWRVLALRAELLVRLRSFFQQRAFLEVETPLLSADVVVDRHLQPLSTTFQGRTLWLQTSPEAGMKRLLAAGGDKIFQVTRSFRHGERGPRHNPEFTLVEWYRRDDTLTSAIDLLDQLSQTLLETPPARRTSYADAFAREAGLDPHTADAAALSAAARRHDLTPPSGFETADRDDWLHLWMAERVEPGLGRDGAEILYDYPASQAALAQVRPGPPAVAERFELYVRGVELANGYHELRDADELRRRTSEENAHRAADGQPPLPPPARLLAAMDHGLPDCCGVALGFDRLVMLAAGASRIDEVIPFPIERA